MGQDRVRARVDRHGRIVIPADFRRELDIEPGHVVMLYIEDGEMRLMTAREGIRRAQALVRKRIPPDRSLVDELIAERREEASRE